MAIDIVKEIITSFKAKAFISLPDFSQLDYEYDIEKNPENQLAKGLGFIPEDVSSSGGVMGFANMSQAFQLILTGEFANKDGDTAQGNKINELYAEAYGIVQVFQSKPLTLPTTGFTVNKVMFDTIDLPEIFSDNGTVALRTNFTIDYRFRNIC